MPESEPHSTPIYSQRLAVIYTMALILHKRYDTWGQRRNPDDWSYDDVPTSHIFDRGFTGHHHLDEFGLINMLVRPKQSAGGLVRPKRSGGGNGRVYDPKLGRFLSPDPIIQSPGNPQNYNRYSYALNNPLKYTDPSGEIFIGAGLFFTDLGYDIQKAVSPIAVHVDLGLGSHSNGIGMDASVGIPQLAPISYRFEAGATYYSNRVGDYGPGWQTRIGGEWGLAGGFIRYGGLQYRDFDSNGNLVADQVVHTAKVGGPLVNIAYSNDTKGSFPWADDIPLVPELREGQIPGYHSDRYRTASGRIRVGLLEAGFFLHTGEGTRISVNEDGTKHFDGGNINDPDRSNGIIYFGLGPLKIGADYEDFRHYMQNRLVHDHASSKPQYGWTYPWILPMWQRDPRLVFQFGNF